MSEKDKLFGAELEQLWLAGNVSLPLAADAYAKASGILHGVGADEKDVIVNERKKSDYFPVATPGHNGFEWAGKALGPVYPEWSHIRQTLQEAFARTAETLQLAAEAMRAITDDYAATDAAAAAEMQALLDERARSSELDTPPASPSVITYPDDPQPPAPAGQSSKPWWVR